MVISHRYRFVFFSNPKTGSESVRAMLAHLQEGQVVPFAEQETVTTFYPHMRPVDARVEFERRGWAFDEYFKLAFVRNPWARLVSLYEMTRSSDGWFGRAKRRAWRARHRVAGRAGFPGFLDWLERIEDLDSREGLANAPKWLRFGVMTLSQYAGDGQGTELLDRIVRLEDAGRELGPVLGEIGLPGAAAMRLPHKNVRRHAGYRRYYDQAAREFVFRRYTDEIERFGYEF